MVMENVIHLAEKKAEKIGAETVVSTSYREYVQEREDYAKANFYLYISKSKNGLMQLELIHSSIPSSLLCFYRNNFFPQTLFPVTFCTTI